MHFPRFLQDSGSMIVGLIVAFYVGWQLALILITLFPIVAALCSFVKSKIDKKSQACIQLKQKISTELIDILSKIKIVKLFGGESNEKIRITNLSNERKQAKNLACLYCKITFHSRVRIFWSQQITPILYICITIIRLL